MTAVSSGAETRPQLGYASTRRFARDDVPQLSGVSVVIPAKNEARNIGWVLRRLPRVDEVIIVDGLSTDGTIDVAKSIIPDVVLVSETTPGKGAALRAGFEAARGDYVVMLDADCSMDPGEITAFVAALQSGYDLVKGSRFTSGGGSADISRLRQLGNWGLMTAVNLLYREKFTDLCYGYIAFRRTALPALELKSDGFEIETEIVVRAILADLEIGEVASYESPRRHGVSNLNTFRDGQRVLRTLLRERLRRRRHTATERPTAEQPAVTPVPVGTGVRTRLGISAVTLGVSALAPMATILGLRMLGVQ